MGHHYLPIKYLKGFATGNAIWVYDKFERRSFVSQPKSVANETNMYGDATERFLGSSVEDPALPSLENVRAHKPLSAEGRQRLARYIVTLWRRVPRTRELVINQLPEQAEVTRHEVHRKLDQMAALDSISERELLNKHKEVDRIVDRYATEGAVEIWQRMLLEHRVRVEEALLSMNWTFLRSKGVQFLTGDHPVFLSEGISRPSSELTVPLSHDVALWASNRSKQSAPFLEARPYAAREINRRTASTALRYLFSKDYQDWALPLLLKERHVLHRLL